MDDRDPHAAAAPLAPGEQADAPWLAPSTRRWLRRALLAWAALAVFLALLQLLTTATWPAPLDWLRRMAGLFGQSWYFLVLPPVAFTLLAGAIKGRWALGRELGGNLGLMAFSATALLWAGVGIAYAIDGISPWDHMPGVTPPYLERFIAEHPQLRVEKINGVYEVELTHREIGGWLRIDGHELAGSRARYERCGNPAPGAEAFDGLPLFPGAQCRRMLTLERPGTEPRVLLRYDTADDIRFDALRRFYEQWARERKLDGGFIGGPNRFDFHAEGGGRRWELHVPNARSAGPSMVIERGGRFRPFGERDAQRSE